MSSLLPVRLPRLLGRSSSNRSSSSGRSRTGSRSGNILEEQGYVQFHDDSSIGSVDLVPVTYTVKIPSPSCRRKGTFYVYDEHRKISIRVKRPENASPGEVIQVNAYVPATTASNPVRSSDDPSYSGSLTATSVSSIEPLSDDGEEGEEEEISAANGDDRRLLFGSSGSGHSQSWTDTNTSRDEDDETTFPRDLPRVLPVGDGHFICDDETQQNLFGSLLNAICFQLPIDIIEEFTYVLHDYNFGENHCVETHTGEARGPFAARLLRQAFQHPSSLDVVKLLVELKRDAFMSKEQEWSDAFQLATPQVFEFLLRSYPIPSLERLTDDSSESFLLEMFGPDKLLDFSSAISRKLQMVIEKYPQALKSTNSTGQTPLHLAILKNEPLEVVRLLVEKCPEAINIQDNLNRDTVLHYAAAWNAPQGAMWLLFENCPESIETKNLNGDTPLELSMRKEKPSWVINLLKKEHEILSGRRIMRGILDDAELGPEELPLGYLEYCTDNFSTDNLRGEGTIGQVYGAEDKAIKRRFAVKKLRVQRNSETSIKEARDSFIHETETLKHFRHRNICRLYGYFLSDDLRGEQCLAFELAGKGSLRDCLAQHGSRRALHWATRVKIAWEVAKAVDYMHTGKAGYTCFHRDIKSSNICLKRNDEAVVIDCGIARLLPHDDSRAPLTLLDAGGNTIHGTPGYICPEYARTRTNFTAACDIFSLGIVFVEIFTGILQGSMDSGNVVDLFNRYRNLNMEIRGLIQDADKSAGEWDARVKENFALLALECISWSPFDRPDMKDIVRRLKIMAAMARPFSPGGRNSITVLYSDPLVWRSDLVGESQDGESGIHALNGPTPNFERERQGLVQSISESGRDIELSFDVATTSRFRKAISRRCGCFHFSGHGDVGYIYFEDGRGGAHFLQPDEVQDLVSELPFELVFVSACHSRLIGEAFVRAGVPHVICCDHGAELQDDAAQSFTEIFYHALALGYPVVYAFKHGKEEVSGRFPLSEAEKFLLLPENGVHDEPIFDAEELDEEIVVHSSRNQFIPEVPKHFLGRKRDAYELLQKILDKRIVKLVGDHGVGCSSLAKYVCRYIEDRKTIFHDIHVIYYLRGGDAVDPCIWQLHELLAAEGKVEEMSVGDEISRVVLLNNIMNALRGAKALIVFDDADDENLIEFLMVRSTCVKILQVTTSLMEVSPHSMEEIFHLGQLDLESSVELFGKHCQHTRNFEALFYKKLNQTSNYPSTETRRRVYQTLEGGIPSQIVRVARGISQEDFLSLFFDP